MLQWLLQKYFALKISMLMLFKSPVLFEQINQLDWYQQTLHQWIHLQKLKANARILEIGCATGALSEYLADSGFSITAVDASPAMIKRAKSGDFQADYRLADVYQLPFADASFDAVIAASLINVVTDPGKALAEMVRVCKADGSISLLFPTQDFNNTDITKLEKSLQVTGFSQAALTAWHHKATKLHLDDLLCLLHANKLTVQSSDRLLQGMVVSIVAIKAV